MSLEQSVNIRFSIKSYQSAAKARENCVQCRVIFCDISLLVLQTASQLVGLLNDLFGRFDR
jgi:hypothetical protein